jgi:hypothetical protein
LFSCCTSRNKSPTWLPYQAVFLILVSYIGKNGEKVKQVRDTEQIRELVEESVTRAPPHLEPIVPNSGNGLRTKPFARLHGLEKCMADPRLG